MGFPEFTIESVEITVPSGFFISTVGTVLVCAATEMTANKAIIAKIDFMLLILGCGFSNFLPKVNIRCKCIISFHAKK